MKVSIISEGNSIVGFGHISRCTSIYQAYEEEHITPTLIINGDESIREILNGKNFILFNWLEQSAKLFELIKNTDIAIIDSYLAPLSIYQNISKLVKIPVFIDDNLRLEYPPGIIINSLIHSEDLNYPIQENFENLLGSEYTMIKMEFWDGVRKIIRDNIDCIMVTFGSNDLRNITPVLLKKLKKSFPNVKKKVIIGKNFQNKPELENIKDDKCEFIFSPNSLKMKECMIEADIAITAGGQTVYELACMGVPTVTIATADIQLKTVEACAKVGLNYYAGEWSDKNLLENIEKSIQNLLDRTKREGISLVSQKLVRSDGSRIIIRFLLNLLNKRKKDL